MRTPTLLAALRRTPTLLRTILGLLLPGLVLATAPVSANPGGANVVHGDIAIRGAGSPNLSVVQGSRHAIIDWNSFSIGQGESVRFIQPNANSAVLNRVTGYDASSIDGALRANGNVFVINPNGIIVGPTGQIDVHGLVLSTLDVKNGEFLAGGDMAFKATGDKGVTNLGRINAVGGDVFLIGRTVTNSGSITASEGTVGLASGEEVLLKSGTPGNERVFVRATGASGGGIVNDGTIEAAAVEMKAHGNIYALAINNSGSVRATSASRSGGRVFLDGGIGGVSNSGSIQASAPRSAGAAAIAIRAAYAKVDGELRARGGDIRISGSDSVALGGTIDVSSPIGNGGRVTVESPDITVGSTTRIDASGLSGGGSVRIGGGFQGNDSDIMNSRTTTVAEGSSISADATESGNGGSVILWSDGDTLFLGDISAKGISAGGFVEVSGRDRLGFDGSVSTLASNGTSGTLLLDPTNGIVSTATQNLTASPFIINSTTLGTSLASNNVVISTPSIGADRGTITFSNNVTWNSANSLSVLAHGDILFNANVQNSGTGAVNIVAGWDGTTGLPSSSPLQNPGSLVISDFLNNSSSYGNAQNGVNGSIFVGNDAALAGIAVGSRNGATNLLGYDLTIQASNTTTADRYAQVGFRDVSTGTDSTGSINIQLHNQLAMTAGNAAVRNYAQIGHGGADGTTTNASGNLSGDIAISAANGLHLNAGAGSTQNYIQIGHGGFQSGLANSSHSGSIRITTATGGITANGGTGTDNAVQIGNGGRLARGEHSGDIVVLTRDDISFSGGTGARALVQIGNGGHDADAGGGTTTKSGAIRVASTQGNILFSSGAGADAYALVGNGGLSTDGDHNGSVTVRAGGNVAFDATAGTGANGFVQIGNGGLNAMGNFSGALTVSAGTSGAFADVYDADGDGIFGEVGDDEITFTRSGDGSLSFAAGGGTDRYAQLGLGGRTARGDHDGQITVNAVGNVSFSGGTATQSYAMLGHGGRDADNPNPTYYPDNDPLTTERGPTDAERIGNSGDISVTSSNGSILFTAGSGTESWVTLGHGGAYNDGDHNGKITVRASEDVIFDASNPSGTTHYAQLGHGGHLASGGRSGNIDVTAGRNIQFTGGPSNSYVQLGHGGRNDHRVNRGGTAPNYVQNNANDRYYPGTHTGNITVTAGSDISFTSGTASASYAQIGHGGYRNAAEAGEGHSGAISVISGGALNFTAQGGGQSFVQIGHGGYESYGNHGYQVIRSEAGSIAATQGGSALLTNGSLAPGSVVVTVDPSGSGAGTATFTDDGNGNLVDSDDSLGFGAGSIVGTINYTTGELTFSVDANTAGDSVDVAYLYGGSDILVEARNGISFSAGTASQSYAQVGHGGYDADFSATRPVRAEEPTAPSTHTGTTTYHLNTPLANPLGTSGNITVRAGYDGTTVTNSNAALTFTGGSGADAHAMIGNGGRATDGDHVGDITVDATGDIAFAGGSHQRTFAQIGNGGHDSDANILTPLVGNRGDIRINTNLIGATIDAMGSIIFLAGSGEESYVQIGHGGALNVGANTGLIDVRSAGSITFTSGDGSGIGDLDGTGSTFVATPGHGRRSYAQIGHGGYDADAASSGGVDGIGHKGEINVLSGGDIRFTASVVTDPAAEDYRNYVMIGHGGFATNGDHSGNITVEAAGNINFTPGGVRASDPINAPVAFVSHDSFAQLGHGGRDSDGYGTADTLALSGNIQVHAGGGIHFTAFNPGDLGDALSISDAYVQLGHGGMNVDGTRHGDIDVVALTGSIVFDSSLAGFDGYAQLGHGGRTGRGDHEGDILVDAAKDITFLGGTTLRTYAQLGHGGHDADYNTGDSARIGNRGDILINTRTNVVANAGNITFTAGNGEEAYVQLGHGGYGTQGAHGGNLLGGNIIDVRTAGDIIFTSGDGSGYGDDTAAGLGNGRRSYAQLGHGGFDSDAASTGGVAGDGHDAKINVNAGGAIRFTATDLVDPVNGPAMQANDYRNYVLIGHGGLASNGDHRGDITVTAGNGIAFKAGGVDPAATTFLSQDAFAQIGHGGLSSDGYGGSDLLAQSGNITVTATNGDIVFTGSNATEAYVQIGHGGRDVDGGAIGNITVTASNGAIAFQAGTAADNYAQVGHGGRTARGDREGFIVVSARDDITFSGGSGARAYAQLGHGGHDADNPNPTYYPDNDPLTTERGPTAAERVGNIGFIEVTTTGGNILFTAGAAGESYVALGHGGAYTDGDQIGAITVNAAGNIIFDASDPTGSNHYAQLGHGGFYTSGGHTGDVVVNAGGAIRFTGSTSGSYVQIGHGGRTDHRLTRGGTTGNYSQANNIDRYYPGTHAGAISVAAGSDIAFTGGDGTAAYAQIGHGGFRNAAEAGEGHSGDISVVGGGAINFTANAGAQAYVQIGHGGYEAFGNHGYQVIRSEAGSVSATQAGSAFLSNGALAAGSIRITIDPTGTGAGTSLVTDDGNGNLIDSSLAVVGTIDYATGEINFTSNVNAAGDEVAVAYLYGSSDILVDGGNGVSFLAGTGTNTNAQIGHGGPASSFSSTLNIQPEETAPATNTSTTTYHLNTPSVDPIGMSGDITVNAGTGATVNSNASLQFTSGGGTDAYAQIGNGGRTARGDHRGDIDVSAANGIAFTAFNEGATSQTVDNNGTLNSRLQNHTAGTYTMAQTGNLERGTIVITYENPLPGFTGTIRSDDYGRLFDGTTQVGTVSTGGVITLTVTVSDSGAGAPNSSIVFDHYNTGLRSYVQIGHGGSEADFPTALTPGSVGNLGNISVTTDNGAISFAAGNRNEAYAQIGNGGYATSGDHSGNILVEALGTGGAITFSAGGRANAYTQLGHGGNSAKGNFGRIDVDGDGLADGDITVRTTGDIAFTAGGNSQTYAQLGHGGYEADAITTAGNPSNRGSILVVSNAGDILFSAAGSNGANSYTQLGHGGYGTYGDFSGDITVRALGGSISFTGGEANERYAQLGHGGRSAKGNQDGNISVTSEDDIRFTAGGIASVQGETSLALLDAAIAGGGATASLVNTANLDLGSLVITLRNPAATEYTTLTTNSTGELLDANGGRVGTVAANGTITFEVAVSAQAASGISVAYDHINYSRGSVQLGNGGYDADPTGATIGVPTMSGNIDVTSNLGGITFSAGIADTNFAHLGNGGYLTSGDHSGNIGVQAAGDIRFTGGMSATTATGSFSSRNNNYAQLGNGGMSITGSGSGTIAVSSSAGEIEFQAGTSADGYVQLGHGGRSGKGDHTGDIYVDAAGDISFTGNAHLRTYAQLGHGGWDADYNTGASANIGNSGDIFVNTRTDLVTNAGGIFFTAGSGEESYVQLGHGGSANQGAHTGNLLGLNVIDVRAAGDLVFTSGDGSGFGDDTAAGEGNGRRSFAQLGHGGFDSDAAATGGVSGDGHNADINVTAGGTIRFTALDLVNPVSGPNMLANDYRNYVQLGHGGLASNGDHGGSITVSAGNGINFKAGGVAANATASLSQDAYAQLGHGGYGADGYGGSTTDSRSGDISVTATAGDIVFTGSNAVDAYVQLGHGGRDVDGNSTGSIKVAALDGSVVFQAGTATDNYAQLGHGGRNGIGNLGDVDETIAVVAANDIRFSAGTAARTYAQLGNGGHGVNGNLAANIQIDAGGNLVATGGTSGSEGYALIGNGGVATGFTRANNSVTTGTRTGDMLVRVDGTTTLTDQNSLAFLGHLGTTGVANGSRLTLVSGTYDMTGSSRGLGGIARNFLSAGPVDIGASAGDLVFTTADYFYNSANSLELFATGDLLFSSSLVNAGSGDISLIAGWDGSTGLDVDFDATRPVPFAAFEFNGTPILNGLGTLSGGNVILGSNNATLASAVGTAGGTLRAAGESVVLLGSNTTSNAFAQLGFNEEVARRLGATDGTAAIGNIEIRSGIGGAFLSGGSASGAFAQIGHGGTATSASNSGNVYLNLDDGSADLVLAGGAGTDAYARVGHGGNRAAGTRTGGISVYANDVLLNGGNGQFANSVIGHGGEGAFGATSGTISITADNEVGLYGGSGRASEARIGHGGHADGSAVSSSSVFVDAGNDITLKAGSGAFSVAQIGHGGYGSTGGTYGGRVEVDTKGALAVLGGSGLFSNAQIGHGGAGSTTDLSGTILVSAVDSITLANTSAGNLGAYAKIGHGDDLAASFRSQIGQGTRTGNISVSSEGGIRMINSLIGHTNAASPATSSNDVVNIGVNVDNPSNPNGGSLVADSGSEFSGQEIRFYLPQRSNNRIARGALLNGVAYPGTPDDPSASRAANEFTIFEINRGRVRMPGEHNSSFNSGPSPVTAGQFAFYYDTVSIDSRLGGGNGGGGNNGGGNGGGGNPGGPIDPENPDSQMDDETIHDQNRMKRKYRRSKPFRIYYVGFDQYGPNGESVFEYSFNTAPVEGFYRVSIDPTASR